MEFHKNTSVRILPRNSDLECLDINFLDTKDFPDVSG